MIQWKFHCIPMGSTGNLTIKPQLTIFFFLMQTHFLVYLRHSKEYILLLNIFSTSAQNPLTNPETGEPKSLY